MAVDCNSSSITLPADPTVNSKGQNPAPQAADPATSHTSPLGGADIVPPETSQATAITDSANAASAGGNAALGQAVESVKSVDTANQTLDKLNQGKKKVVLTANQVQTNISANPAQANNPMTVPGFTQYPTQGAFLKDAPNLVKRYDQAITKVEDLRNYYATQAQGNYASFLDLSKNAQQLFKQAKDLGSDLGIGGGSDAAQSFQSSQSPPSVGNSLLNDSQQSAESLSGKGSDSVDFTRARAGSESMLSMDSKEKDLNELLDTSDTKDGDKKAVVPESFVSELEKRLSQVREEKDALAVVREMGKQAGVDSLANLGSLGELNDIDKLLDKSGVGGAGMGALASASGAGAGAAGGASVKSGDDAGDRMARARRLAAKRDEDAEFMKSVQGALQSTIGALGGKDEKDGGHTLNFAAAGGAHSGTGRFPNSMSENDPRVGVNAELFHRVHKIISGWMY